jgi:hypothetical protein
MLTISYKPLLTTGPREPQKGGVSVFIRHLRFWCNFVPLEIADSTSGMTRALSNHEIEFNWAKKTDLPRSMTATFAQRLRWTLPACPR